MKQVAVPSKELRPSVGSAASADRTRRRPGQAGLAFRYLWWLVSSQQRRVWAGALWGTLWTTSLMVPPYPDVIGYRAGLQSARLPQPSAGWVALLVAVGLIIAWLEVMRHRTMTRKFVRHERPDRPSHAAWVGAALPRLMSTSGGDVTIGSTMSSRSA